MKCCICGEDFFLDTPEDLQCCWCKEALDAAGGVFAASHAGKLLCLDR